MFNAALGVAVVVAPFTPLKYAFSILFASLLRSAGVRTWEVVALILTYLAPALVLYAGARFGGLQRKFVFHAGTALLLLVCNLLVLYSQLLPLLGGLPGTSAWHWLGTPGFVLGNLWPLAWSGVLIGLFLLLQARVHSTELSGRTT